MPKEYGGLEKMKKADIIKLIEKTCINHIHEEQKQRTQWTSMDFKLVNRLKHKLIYEVNKYE